MATLPTNAEMTGSGVTEGGFKGKLNDFLTFIRDTMGTNGTVAAGRDIALVSATYAPVENTAAIGGGRRSLLWEDPGTTFNPLRLNQFPTGVLNFNATGATFVAAVRIEGGVNNNNLGPLIRLQREGEAGSLNRQGIVTGVSAGVFHTASWAGASNSSAATENYATADPGTKVMSARLGKNIASELRDNDTITNAGSATAQDVTVTGGWNLSIGGAFKSTGATTPRVYMVAAAVYSDRLSDTDLAAVRNALAAAANVSITV